jgi:hypothetical protein
MMKILVIVRLECSEVLEGHRAHVRLIESDPTCLGALMAISEHLVDWHH